VKREVHFGVKERARERGKIGNQETAIIPARRRKESV